MAAIARYYSSTAVKTTLSSSIGSSDTTMTVASMSGFPSSYPYTLILEKDSANEEIVTVTAVVGTSLTITRGVDGTSGRSHSAGISVEHGVIALDFTNFRSHEAAGSNVHDIGSGASVVGTTTTQTLSNKTLGSALAAGGFKITGLADPTNAQDAATKNWAETGMTSQLSQATAAKVAAQAAQAAAETAETNAETAQSAAAASQSAAATSATSAGTSATNAASSASSASTSASTATTQASNASTSATAAAGSASSASTSAATATTKASEAATSATNAASSATSASGSASTATTKASEAATSATGAASSASSASASASTATTKASEASTSATNAAGSASSAGTSATNAAGSATTASTQASNAATSATAAGTSATNAATSATAAASSASAASTSATSASGSASTATTKASEASASATDAATSATAASGSASTASTAATNAASSASSASTSATTATGAATTATTQATSATSSASAAETSATNAATSETNAAASAASAATLFDNFDDRYLGSKTSDPTLDNDGNALLTGALYFNSATSAMKVYTGSAWALVAPDTSTFISKTIVDAKGDLIVGTSGDTVARIGVGTDGYVLTANSAETPGVKWSAPTMPNGRNWVVNGAFNFWQRNAAGVATTGTGQYTADRWWHATSTSGGTGGTNVGQATQTFGGPDGTALAYALRSQRYQGRASNNIDVLTVSQAFEGPDVYLMRGQQVTLSFYARVGANYSGGTDGNRTLSVQLLAGTNYGMGNTGTMTSQTSPISASIIPTTSWQRYSFTGTIPANSGSMRIVLTRSCNSSPAASSGANDYLDVTGVQLELGSQATVFDYRTYTEEFKNCSRYWQFVNTSYTTGIAIGANSLFVNFPIRTEMRTSPTISQEALGQAMFAFPGTISLSYSMSTVRSSQSMLNYLMFPVNANTLTDGKAYYIWDPTHPSGQPVTKIFLDSEMY